MKERTDEVILVELNAAKAAHHAGKPGMSETIKKLQDELSRYITAGAGSCPDCDEAPHGMRQEGTVGQMKIVYYEIGCLSCRDHRAQGQTREQAVENWNNGVFKTPRE